MFDDGLNSKASRVSLLAVVVAVALAGALAAGTIAAQNVHDGSADPAVVNESDKQKHTFTYAVDNVSNDGSSDTLYLTFPNRINQSTNDLSSFSGNVTNANTGASVSISSSPSIVDGPDGDGVEDTVSIGIQPEGERLAIDVVVRFTGYVTWPNVSTTTDLPVKAAVTDSKYADVPPTTFVAVTVEDLDGAGSTTTETTTAETTDGQTTESTTKATTSDQTNDATTTATQTTADQSGDGTATDETTTTATATTATTQTDDGATDDETADEQTTEAATGDSSGDSDGSGGISSSRPLVVFGAAALLLGLLGLGTFLTDD